MAHYDFQAQEAARATVAALRHLSVLPRTVRQDVSAEFVQGQGQTINVPAPVSAGEAKVYTKQNADARDAIQFSDLTRTWVPVKLEDQVYSAVRLPDAWATFTLRQLAKDVLRPQAEAVVDGLAKPLIDVMKATKAPLATGRGADVAYNHGTALKIAADGSNAMAVVLRLRKLLNDRKVPTSGRTLALGSAVAELLLANELLTSVAHSGASDALREATIGRLRGFDVVESGDLPEDMVLAYHKDAFTLATRVPRVPEGAAHGAVVAQDGFSLRHILHYNPIQLEDQSVVSTFAGAAALAPQMAVAAGLAA